MSDARYEVDTKQIRYYWDSESLPDKTRYVWGVMDTATPRWVKCYETWPLSLVGYRMSKRLAARLNGDCHAS